jgi:hypothetical protein
MNWEAVAAIAEALGALAVFASLVYLALQIRQNTASIKASTYDSFVSQQSDLANLVLSDEAIGRVWARGFSKLDELDPTERARFGILMERLFRHLESAHRQCATGLIDSDLFDAWWKSSLRYAREPGAMAWWQANQEIFTPTFREFVDHQLGLRS